MKIVAALTAAVILSATFIGSAIAQTGTHDHTECLHEATIASVRTCVIHAVDNGHIGNQGIARSLLAKLDTADKALTRGQQAVATRQLQAVLRELDAQAGKHIAQPHADHLAQHVELVIAEFQ